MQPAGCISEVSATYGPEGEHEGVGCQGNGRMPPAYSVVDPGTAPSFGNCAGGNFAIEDVEISNALEHGRTR
eukprot:2016678-Pyramimonas_sp.AAC.1